MLLRLREIYKLLGVLPLDKTQDPVGFKSSEDDLGTAMPGLHESSRFICASGGVLVGSDSLQCMLADCLATPLRLEPNVRCQHSQLIFVVETKI